MGADPLAQGLEVAERHLHGHDGLATIEVGLAAQRSAERVSISWVTFVTGRKLPRSTRTGA